MSTAPCTTPKVKKPSTFRVVNGVVHHQCSGCHKWKLANTDEFVHEHGSKTGLGGYCKVCNAAKMSTWRTNNKLKANAQSARYVARVRSAGAKLTEDDLQLLLDLCGKKCCACGLSSILVGELEADHVVPVSKHGSNHVRNRQMLCAKDNKIKGCDIIDFRTYPTNSMLE